MTARTVVLDGYTLNPGDLTWDSLKALGECEVHDRTPPTQVVERASGARIVLTNKTVLSRATIEQLPQLKSIGVLATRYNVVDVEAARRQGICVTNVPAYSTASVAQMAFAHLLHFALHVGEHGRSVRDSHWSRSPDFCYWDYPLVEGPGDYAYPYAIQADDGRIHLVFTSDERTTIYHAVFEEADLLGPSGVIPASLHEEILLRAYGPWPRTGV